MFFRTSAFLLIALFVCAIPARAERPIVDLHRLDAYFALFASDSNVPWKPTTVRLDTYSSAPVLFSIYQVDPVDVLTAGSNARPRAISTRGRRAIGSFTFAPPGGYQFASNEIDVQLGTREGFFVVEARRGSVGEQVWINRSRVGLVSKETPNQLLLYGTDLGTGRALARMRVQLVVNNAFVTTATDDRGLLTWTRSPRPVFALAQWGSSYAFLSLLPQAPLPSTIVGVRTDSAVVHAGDTVRVVGFARSRIGNALRPSGGNAVVSLRSGARVIAERQVPLDGAGAFSAAFVLPSNAQSGDYAVLAQTGGGIGGATVHVDSNAGGLSLDVGAQCGVCDPAQDVPLLIRSSHSDATVHVTVVRSPHVYVDYAPETTPWATTVWLDESLQTGSDGTARVLIPHPNDDLGSTYGVHVDSGGATADTRVVVPTGRAAVRLTLDRDEQTLGMPVGFDVYANDAASGKPLAGAVVIARMTHGAAVAQQQLTLDGEGHARGSFASPQLGTNLVFASVDDSGRAMDAAAVQVEARALGASPDQGSADVHLTLGKPLYRGGDDVAVDAVAPGSSGDALVTLESAAGTQPQVVGTANGRASAHFRATNATGELRVGSAFVRDGALEWATTPLGLEAPGRPQLVSLALERDASYAPGEAAKISFAGDAPGVGTVVVRVSRGAPSGGAQFDSAPALLAVGAAATQSSAPASTTWHPWVDSTGDHAQVLGFVRKTQPPSQLSLAQAESRAVSWSVARAVGGTFAVAMPTQSGRYTLSVLEISDDGSVSAGSSGVVVR
ncbi:MAG: hypothetical protein JOZ01_05140 [Candidatus Eremiobacteraeota bacterium]|nr:hypothetical protein [Candidatus Eremiobacteraeota bacterium]